MNSFSSDSQDVNNYVKSNAQYENYNRVRKNIDKTINKTVNIINNDLNLGIKELLISIMFLI